VSWYSPRRAKLGGLPLGMRSVDTPPPTPTAGAPPAGPWQEPNWRIIPAASVITKNKCDHTVISDNNNNNQPTRPNRAYQGQGRGLGSRVPGPPFFLRQFTGIAHCVLRAACCVLRIAYVLRQGRRGQEARGAVPTRPGARTRSVAVLAHVPGRSCGKFATCQYFPTAAMWL
jgi:hypothetical protein